jgi:hypothetical protein
VVACAGLFGWSLEPATAEDGGHGGGHDAHGVNGAHA